MRPTRTTNPSPIVTSAALALAAGLWLGTPAARAQSFAGPYRGQYQGYYYSPGGHSGGYYFHPGYYLHPGYYRHPAAPVVAPARPYYPGYSSRPYTGYFSTATRHPSYTNSNDWSTGRSNDPIPLTKPWMKPNRY